MYTITKQDKEMISNYLKSVVVPSVVGSNLIQIANLLDGLKEVEEVKKTK